MVSGNYGKPVGIGENIIYQPSVLLLHLQYVEVMCWICLA